MTLTDAASRLGQKFYFCIKRDAFKLKCASVRVILEKACASSSYTKKRVIVALLSLETRAAENQEVSSTYIHWCMVDGVQ